MRLEDVEALLKPYNPWWGDGDWDEEDPLLARVYRSALKNRPRLYYHLQRIVRPGAYGIVTVRGPRRVGKTTLIKLLVKYLIGRGVDPRSIFYVSLDYEGLSNIKLVELLQAIAERGGGEKYVFIDEASMYPGWAQVMKNMYDMGFIERGRVKILAAGSHSMDLAEAASKLRGRQGALAQLFNLGGNLVHMPLRFSEVVESLKTDIDDVLSESRVMTYRFRKPKARFLVLRLLKQGHIHPVLRKLYDEYFQLLKEIFDDYLVHGGYPRAVNEYQEKGRISNEFYSEVAELLISDSARAGLDPENLRRVLLRLTEPVMLSGQLNPRSPEIIGRDEDARPKGRFGLRDYLDYLRTTWAFFFPYPEEGGSGSCKPNYSEKRKNYVLDPFIYHALYSYLNNVPDPFGKSREMVAEDGFRGRLVESVVASHLLLAQQLFAHIPSVEYDRVLMYKPGGAERETDFILCMVKDNEGFRFKIESKYRNIPAHVPPEEGKIVLTKDILDVRRNMAYIPVPLFLLLF